jgi:hypothetical protein
MEGFWGDLLGECLTVKDYAGGYSQLFKILIYCLSQSVVLILEIVPCGKLKRENREERSEEIVVDFCERDYLSKR